MANPHAFEPVRIYVPLGSLGVGVTQKEVDAALARKPHVMAMDAGSTDSGAAYLAKGVSKNTRDAVKNDLKLLMAAQQKAGIPMLVGTCGQAGGDLNVDWTRDIVLEVARENGYTPKVALLYSEQTSQLIKRKLAEGKVAALAPAKPLDEETIDACEHIVALMGPEPYFEALEAGADIILGGRGTDPAVIAAFALWKGAPAGPSWHAGKIGECGGQSTTSSSGASGLFIEIHAGGFDVEPLDPDTQATVDTVSAHLLYENKNPWQLTEPGGMLDATGTDYQQLTPTKVRVTGSVWKPQPYTMKLEGASARQFQTIMFVGISEPNVLDSPDLFHDKMLALLQKRVKTTMGLSDDEFHISLRMYGWNGVSGRKPPAGSRPLELGVMFVATAKTQALATQMAKACNPYFFHMPIRSGITLPSYGFPFTPADIERGPVYQFELNHVVRVENPMELVRMQIIDLAVSKDKVSVDA